MTTRITIVALVLFSMMMASFGLAATRFRLASAESGVMCVPDEETRERIRVIMIDALDEALHDQIKALFQVWMKDERGQPDRAKIGARAAIQAHQSARKAALEWSPKTCT